MSYGLSTGEKADSTYDDGSRGAQRGGLSTQRYDQRLIQNFWSTQVTNMEGFLRMPKNEIKDEELRPVLPLARIKKVMRADHVVSDMMIAGEVPLLLSKLCEVFAIELTLRGWIQTEEARRKTLQRSDICAAAGRCEMYDFLIDIIPRGTMYDVLDAPDFSQLRHLPAQQEQPSQQMFNKIFDTRFISAEQQPLYFFGETEEAGFPAMSPHQSADKQ